MKDNVNNFFLEYPGTPHCSHEKNKIVREKKACEQYNLQPTHLFDVFCYINEFFNKLKGSNHYVDAKKIIDGLVLDKQNQIIIDNGIIARNCKWKVPVWDNNIRKYSIWEHKYSDIQKKFNLSNTKNILWFKFTESGHLGVVAKGMDINFNSDNTSGDLINHLNAKWNESFVYIFPLTDAILNGKSTGDIEKAVGNYLIYKGVPVIDFYSHNY